MKFTGNYRVKQFYEANRLRQQGFKLKGISIKTGIPKSTIRYWVSGKSKPFKISEDFKNAVNKRCKQIQPKINKDFAYLYGVLLGDGYLDGYSYHIGLSAKDKDFVDEFSIKLRGWSKSNLYRRHISNGQYSSVLCSKQAYQFFKNFDRADILNWTTQFKRLFLKGMYDSEGFVYISKRQRIINLCNQDEILIDLCIVLLSELGFNPRKKLIKCKGNSHILNGNLIVAKKDMFLIMLSNFYNLLVL